LWAYPPQTKFQAHPQIEILNTINQWIFSNFHNVKPSCTKGKPPIDGLLATVVCRPQNPARGWLRVPAFAERLREPAFMRARVELGAGRARDKKFFVRVTEY